MNNTTSRILSVLFALASVVLWISDRVHQLPLPAEVAQYWPGVTAIAILLMSFQRSGAVSKADVERALDALVARPKGTDRTDRTDRTDGTDGTERTSVGLLLVGCLLLGGCAEYAVRPSVEYRSRGISASIGYDGKTIRPKVVIYDKNELKGFTK